MKKIIVTIIAIMMALSLASCSDTEPVSEPVNTKTMSSSRSLSKEEEIELFDKFEAGLISKEYLEEVLMYSRSNNW